MYITWLGHSCFKIQTKPQKDSDEITVITDPYDRATGLRLPRTTAQIVTVSHSHHDHNFIDGVSGEPFVINQVGEYEVRQIFIYGLASFHDKNQGQDLGKNIIYKIQSEGLTIAHLGDLGHPLDNGLLEKLEGTDILFVPVGGEATLSGKQAAEIVAQIEPRIVIPMHYKIPGLTIKLDTADGFLREMGASKKEVQEKLKITQKDLPAEKTQVVLLAKK